MKIHVFLATIKYFSYKSSLFRNWPFCLNVVPRINGYVAVSNGMKYLAYHSFNKNKNTMKPLKSYKLSLWRPVWILFYFLMQHILLFLKKVLNETKYFIGKKNVLILTSKEIVVYYTALLQMIGKVHKMN